MLIKQARDAARRWVIEEASTLPGFFGAYTAGSNNWLPDAAGLNATSDFDVVVVLSDSSQPGRRSKFVFENILFDVTYLRSDQLASAEHILSNYHLAPSFRTTNILLDPSGHLTELLATVQRNYARREWVRKRCTHARNKVQEYLRSIQDHALFHDQLMAWLFAAGVTTHILLVAGLRNPTVRLRYMAVRELLAEYGHLEFHEQLIGLLGAGRINHQQASRHLSTLADIFDVAKNKIKTAFPFAGDISDSARSTAIDGSLELIKRGYHREAMFWIAVTHSRCQKVIACDAPDRMMDSFKTSYQELAHDIRVASSAEIQRRAAEVELMLPRVWDLAEAMMGSNHEIEHVSKLT